MSDSGLPPHGDVSGVHQRVVRGGKKLVQRVRPRRPGGVRSVFSPLAMNLAGIAAAIVVFVSSNVLGARFFKRWDVTSDALYTLSQATIDTLASLRDEIDVVVFLSRADPLSSSTRHMLDAYRTHTDQLRVRFVDPDRDPVEFIALQREYGIFEGRTDNGRLATEASIVVARGERRWYVTTDDIIVFDEEDGSARPRLEAVLTEGIVNVLERQQVQLCFTQGHRELALSSGGPQGLAEFRRRVSQNNYEARVVDLSVADPATAAASCDAIVVVGPLATFSSRAARALRGHLESGRSLLLAVGPLVDEEGQIGQAGLGPVLEGTGITLGRNLLFERDESLRMPVGFGGEVFLATPVPHPVTRGLLVGESVRQRVLVQLTQALTLSDQGLANALLHSSDQSVTIDSFTGLSSGDFLDRGPPSQSAVVAAAAELSTYRRSDAKHPARLVVIGTSSVLWSSTWLEPSLLGTRQFVENALSWLAAQPTLVSVPEKRAQPAGLFLTEESLSEVQRYVLLYVPLAVALLGAFVVLRRQRELELPRSSGAPRAEHASDDDEPKRGEGSA